FRPFLALLALLAGAAVQAAGPPAERPGYEVGYAAPGQWPLARAPARIAPGQRRRSMQHRHLQFGHGFRVVLGDWHSQAAQMTLGPGETEGGPDNRHSGAYQWLYVVSGTGEAVVNGERVALREGTLVLIERGEAHEVRNTGAGPLR